MAAVNPLLNPGATLSGPALLAAAKALTDAQLKGPLADLAAQIAANNKQTAGAQTATSNAFNTLGDYAKQNVADQGNISAGLNQNLADIANQTQQQIGAAGQNAQNMLARYTPQSDQSNSLRTAGAGSLASELARQQGLAAQNQGAFRMFGANQGANYQGLAASNLGTYALHGQEALRNIAQAGQLKNQPLSQKQADLIASRGALLASNEGKLRQQEINNQLSAAGLNVRLQDIQAANQRNAATIRGANQRNAATITAAGQRTADQIAAQAKQGRLDRASREAIAAANRAAKAQGKPPVYTVTGQRALTPDRQQAYFNQIDQVRALIKQGQGAKLTNAQIINGLSSGNNPTKMHFAGPIIQAAMALQGWGYLTPSQIAGLNKMGLIVGNRYKRGNAPPPPGHGVGWLASVLPSSA
jgi:hypothetical protein